MTVVGAQEVRMPRMRLWTSVVAVVPLAFFSALARADDPPPTEREKALEKRVEEMQKQIDALNKKISDGASYAGDELSSRVAELEKLSRKDKDGLFAYWGNGIRMDSASGAFKLKI